MKKLNIHIKRQLLIEKAMPNMDDIINRIKTFEDACAELNINHIIFPDFCTKDEIAYSKLKIITKTLNEGWEPNWKKTTEQKWYPWFNFEVGSSLVLNGTFYDYANAGTTIGSRFCFQTKELAEYAGKQFIDLYYDYLT